MLNPSFESQVQEFEQYSVPSITINHDTPHNKTLWNEHSIIFLLCQSNAFPKVEHSTSHAAAEGSKFHQADWFFFIDEAHFIITAREPKAGKELVFRVAYGNITEVLVQLLLEVPVALFSATLPQLMLKQIIKSLNLSMDITDTFMLTTNRPNISHTVIPMVDSIKNLSNLKFLVSVPFNPPMSYPPKLIIFIDHKLSMAAVARYLNTCLPEAVHSNMLTTFQGINVTDVRLVVQFGVTIDICEREQHAR
ncbi:hypothetical protein CY34DRAFT_107835 [Suillus luteus UH-Slu-Lm8-n1]|uniref:RNA helicase n=1 Tax=Suillus luteus UH-Slu-Lm8-n1 TaxID=930992 RepID=A0A0D0B182_9AGAM|nr:hypothetical protein CY34DRAFT_107835 [Suillus luteus UH-Slu-Lm8-n1]